MKTVGQQSKLRSQSKSERDATAIGVRSAVTPRSDPRFVRPQLGNAAGLTRPPDAIWMNTRGDGKSK